MISFRLIFSRSHPILKNKLKSFCTSASLLNRIATTTIQNDRLQINWQNGEKSEFHNVWLRDHCKCEECFNYSTNQREYDIINLSLDIKPSKVTSNEDELQLTWPDGHSTIYSAKWLHNHAYKTTSPASKGAWVEPFLWNKHQITSADVPQVTYQSLMQDNKELFKASYGIEKFGFTFIHETPTQLSATKNVAERLGGFVRETHFGSEWEFSNKAMDHADTAYTSSRLEAHTDNTYFSDPCGLQVLHCVGHNGSGGENLLVDGFNAAAILKKKDPEAFEFLTSRKIPALYADDSLYIQANGSVIELNPYWGHVQQIRFNFYDRDVLDCLDPDDVPKFYQAYHAFASIIRDSQNEYWVKLTPGMLLVMANWRVMHGRDVFTGVRTMQGCYCNKDDFKGQFRSQWKTFKDELD